MKYLLKIAYIGTAYHGFQAQNNAMSIQRLLTDAASRLFAAPCEVTGCSRTDAGVHANEFCITIENDGGTIPPDKLPLAAAKFLPEDISLFYAE